MEKNKILFLIICIICYAFLAVFIGKFLTKKIKKLATDEDNFNHYAIIFSGYVLCIAIIGKELFTVLSDVFSILQLNNSNEIQYFRPASVFVISGLLILIISYYLAFLLLKTIFDKTKIKTQYSTDQFGYFLLFGILMISMSFIFTPLYHELLLLFSPKIEVGLYN